MNTPVFLTATWPFSESSGARLRDTSLIRALLQIFPTLDLISFEEPSVDHPSPPQVRVHWSPKFGANSRNSIFKKIHYPFRSYLLNGYSKSIEQKLNSLVSPKKLLFLSRLSMGAYLDSAKKMGYTVWLDEHNIEGDLWLDGIKLRIWQYPLALQTLLIEKKWTKLADEVSTSSQKDFDRIRSWHPNSSLHYLPNTLDCSLNSDFEFRSDGSIFFSGTLDYFPNTEGIRWFIENVLDDLRHSFSKARRITVAGRGPSEGFIKMLNEKGIETKANPSDIKTLLRQARVLIVPLLTGSGTRLKIIEAATLGIPVVTTSKGVEGLTFNDRDHVWIGDGPQGFLKKLIDCLTHEELSRKKCQAARLHAQANYDWRTLVPLFQKELTKRETTS